MKPVSFQGAPPSVSGGHPNLATDHILNASNVMYCEKCQFASADAAAFKKHMIEHLGTRFYCFYCNSVSFSEAELNAHLKQHAAKYPFKCPHCGQGYMRRLCLVKHIDRLHNKSNSQGPAKSGMTKTTLSNASPSMPTAAPSPARPAVRVIAPKPQSTPVLSLGKEEQRAKTLDTNVSNVTNRNAERVSPLNGLIHHNRALTVSLPDEVTIPAGCLVELVEVKTVNGTKELKLRLITQQENESVIKDTRTTVSHPAQGAALGKPLSSTLNHPNTVNTMSMGACTVNRKQCETNTVNVERPPAVSVSAPKNIPNHASTTKVGLKRTSSEIINLECNTVIPKKIPKSLLDAGIRVSPPANVKAAAPTGMSSRVSNRQTSRFHPDNMTTSVNLNPEHSQAIPPRRASDTKTIPSDAAVPVKLEPAELHLKNNIASHTMKDIGSLNQQSLKPTSPPSSSSLATDVQARLPTVSVCKADPAAAAAADPSFPARKTLNETPSLKTPVLSDHANSKVFAWPHKVRSNERAGEGHGPKPEGFPVISSVFSLSQQPEEAQGSIQPLVMALRGIVMDKNNSSCSASKNHASSINRIEAVKEVPKAEEATNSRPVACDPLAEETSDCIKKEEEHDKGIQHPPSHTQNHIHVKEEKNNSTKTTNDNKCSHSPATESLREVEAPSEKVSHVDASVATDSLQMAKSEHDICSLKFPTVSLKRVEVGVWENSNRGLKLRISKYKTQVPAGSMSDCTVIYPMPLKVNQLVKRPGPYQPVVVLNHPKPRAPVQGARADSVADTGAPGVVPKCQILKMRLSKVMGQKYEVMGCTVRVFP